MEERKLGSQKRGWPCQEEQLLAAVSGLYTATTSEVPRRTEDLCFLKDVAC